MNQLQEVMLRWQETFQCVAILVAFMWFWVNIEKTCWKSLSIPLLIFLATFGYDLLLHWRF